MAKTISDVERAKRKKEKLLRKLEDYKRQVKEAEHDEKLAQQREVMKAISSAGFTVDEAIDLLKRNAKEDVLKKEKIITEDIQQATI